ncbi:MAG: aminoacyl-tRNA hydrolase, partial [Clostridia bacterium]|nr:aminoacyl-tRNA hydrolase [Clostridia bacterium]
MYLIVGLGNPESDYSKTRHNMGFDVINKLSDKFDIKVNKSKFKALYGTGLINGEKVVFVKPQTYMNLSGEAIIRFIRFYKISLSKVIIIYDDI